MLGFHSEERAVPAHSMATLPGVISSQVRQSRRAHGATLGLRMAHNLKLVACSFWEFPLSISMSQLTGSLESKTLFICRLTSKGKFSSAIIIKKNAVCWLVWFCLGNKNLSLVN